MSQITADSHGSEGAGHGGHHHGPALDIKAVTLPEGYGRLFSTGLIAVGILAAIVTLVIGGAGENARHALGSYLVGFGVAVALALGSLAWVMIFQQTNAGWSAGLRRIHEAVASQFWVCFVLFIPIALFANHLYGWLDPHLTEGDVLYEGKRRFLNFPFWLGRSIFYFAIWSFMGMTLYRWSRLQDQTGDKWLTAKMRRLSAPGLLVFALTTAFASFDWFMGLDYHWYSTMFGVYYFAGAAMTAASFCSIVLAVLRLRGKLNGVITAEHFHDQGKLMFTFIVFWSYVAFFQYFLIWYATIPEETMWFQYRAKNGWENVGMFLCIGHFGVPFLLLLWRGVKRSTRGLLLVASWLVFMEAADMFFIVRPAVYEDRIGFSVIDVLGTIAPICIFMGMCVRKICSGPLVPLNDPRLGESLHHKNYV